MVMNSIIQCSIQYCSAMIINLYMIFIHLFALKEVEVENRSHYAIINQKTAAPTVFVSGLFKLILKFGLL